MTSRKNRIISGLILIVFSFVIFSSACFIIKHADHECTGEDCPFCTELSVCGKILQTLGNAVSFAAITAVVFFSALSDVNDHLLSYSDNHNTLISLKVELLN